VNRRRALEAAPSALLAAAGVALAVVLALAPAAGAPQWLGPLATLGGLAAALYAAGMAMPWPAALPWALGLLAVEYLAGLEIRRAPLDPAAPTYAVAFFLCAELGWLGLEARRGGRPWTRRVAAIAGLAVGGSVLAALLLLLAAVPLGGGPPMTALGVAATIAVAACLAWLGRRSERLE
jgi:hypothetical protein